MKVALVGLGAMGRRHLKTLEENSDITEIFTVDSDVESGAFYPTMDELFANLSGPLNFAVIATPTTTHKDLAIKLMRHGMHVFVEKPVVSSMVEIKELLDAANDTGCKIAVGHVERFNPAVRALVRDLDKKPLSCSIRRLSPYPARITDVGVALDLSIHDIDLVRHITGQEIKLSYAVATATKGSQEDTIMYLLHLSGGTTVQIHTSWLAPFRTRAIEIVTADATYYADLLAQNLVKHKNQSNNEYIVESVFTTREDALQSQLKAYINYIRTNDKGNLCLLEDAAEALHIVEESL